MTTTQTTALPTTLCLVCSGTGTDPGFGDRCEPCHGTGRKPTARTASRTDGPTERQVAFFTRLCGERMTADAAEVALRGFLLMTKRQASEAIDMAMALPRIPVLDPTPAARPTTGLDLSGIPTGFYAVPGGDTRLKVQIRNVAKGKWSGWTFVSDGAEYGFQTRYGSQKPGETYSGRLVDQLTAIAADPRAAAAAYGHLTGSCGVCGRHLEDEQSVERGIGPVCWAKF